MAAVSARPWTARDGLTQPRHLTRLARGVVRRRRRAPHGGGRLGYGRGARPRVDAAIMSPGDPPVLPEPGTVEASILPSAASPHRRRQRNVRRGDRAGLGSARLRPRGRRPTASWSRSSSGLPVGLPPACHAAPAPDLSEQGPDCNGAVLGGDVGEHAGGRRRHFDGDLSVSSSTSGSSTATGSPGFLNHLPMVASVTDPPRSGISLLLSFLRLPMPGIRLHQRGGMAGTSPAMTNNNQPSARLTNALSCARCFDIWPTAVAADAGRPARSCSWRAARAPFEIGLQERIRAMLRAPPGTRQIPPLAAKFHCQGFERHDRAARPAAGRRR